MSETTTSNGCSASFSSASSPDAATLTTWPDGLSMRTTALVIIGSSSTASTRNARTRLDSRVAAGASWTQLRRGATRRSGKASAERRARRRAPSAPRCCPPCCSTMPNTIARPRPVPLSPLVVKNGSNTRSWTSALMPTPESATSMMPCPSSTTHPQADRAARRQRIDGVEDEIGHQLAQLGRRALNGRAGRPPRCAG